MYIIKKKIVTHLGVGPSVNVKLRKKKIATDISFHF